MSNVLFCALMFASAGIAQKPDFSKVEIKSTLVAKNVHMLEGMGGNIGVSVGADGLLIVDDQFAELGPKIKKALGKLGKGKLKYVLNTHWHGDHTGSNPLFGKDGASIVAHDNVRKRLITGAKVGTWEIPPAAPEALPVLTFNQAMSVYFNGEEIRAIHLPAGHTDGDIVIHFTGSNVFHLGDLFFNGIFPFIDIDSGGSIEGYIKDVELMIARIPADAKIIPGHGPLGTVEDLKNFHAMLLDTAGVVRQKIAAKKSLDDIKKEGLPEKYKPWSWQFIDTDKFIEILHRGLSTPAPK
jgi:cyclase